MLLRYAKGRWNIGAYANSVSNGLPSFMPLWNELSKRRYRAKSSSTTASEWYAVSLR